MIKKICVLLICLALIALFVIFCQKTPTNHIENKPAIPPSDRSSRPDIGPGESNWTPSLKKSTSSGITTTDLNAMNVYDVVSALIGAGPNAPNISNISFTGTNIACGTFSGGTGIVGFENGIILSSGNISSVPGPNVSDGITTNNGLPGDSDLDGLIPGYTTNDATVLEFDFECEMLQVISFQYVFTSDEYNEYVNTAYNDVFGFFLNGVNIALLPDGVTPVSINNVNCGNPTGDPTQSNCSYYINNDLDDGGGTINTEMDGLTVVFTATSPVNPGVNHIKLAIADAGDHILDSNVFIKGESFLCAPPSIDVPLDIKPQSCPNPLNINSVGTFPVAILGTNDFDITQVDLATIQLEGVSPLRVNEEDVATPFEPYIGKEDCNLDCTTEGPDGQMDLTMKFDTQTIVGALGAVNDGDCLVLKLTGNLLDGTPIEGEDVVVIKKKN